MDAEHLSGPYRRRIVAEATPFLEPGETVELVAAVGVGTVTLRRQIAVAATTAVLSAGLIHGHVQPKKHFAVLTSRRLLLLKATEFWGRPLAEVVLEVPRDQVTAGKVRRALTPSFDLEIAGSSTALRIAFPMSYRRDARRFADALGTRFRIG